MFFRESFESKTIKIAMGALRKTTGAMPESSAEYFPPPAIMKATLKENFFPQQSKASLQKTYGFARPDYAAYYLLDYVGNLFMQHKKNDMAAWCMAAKDILSPREIKG